MAPIVAREATVQPSMISGVDAGRLVAMTAPLRCASSLCTSARQ